MSITEDFYGTMGFSIRYKNRNIFSAFRFAYQKREDYGDDVLAKKR